MDGGRALERLQSVGATQPFIEPVRLVPYLFSKEGRGTENLTQKIWIQDLEG